MNTHNLKRVRKNMDIPLQDMAFLLDTDISNLSKYERGVKDGTLKIFLGYFIITGTPLVQLLQVHILEAIESIAERTAALIRLLEEGMVTPKVMSRLDRLHQILNTVSCLHETNKKMYEDQ